MGVLVFADDVGNRSLAPVRPGGGESQRAISALEFASLYFSPKRLSVWVRVQIG